MPRRHNFSSWPCVQSRRQFLAQAVAGFGAALLFDPALASAGQSPPSSPQAVNPTPPRPLAPADHQLLDQISKASAQFFFEQSHPDTGLTKDRSSAEGNDSRDVASIAATGFGLTALCIAHKRGWADAQRISEQVRVTLRFAWNKIPH